MFDISNYFEQFLKAENIFKNRDVLRPEFIPAFLPHRDRQIQQIAEIVACTLKNAIPSNVIIFGKTGTGKTAVVKYVSEKLNAQLKQVGKNESTWIFLNCQQVNTEYRILAKIANTLNPDKQVPIAGWPMDVVLDHVIEALENHTQGICFLVLDEIDVLVKNSKRSQEPVLYNLVRINERLHNTHVSIIGISNDLNFKSFLDPRILSSLNEEEIVFSAYDALELQDILRQRAEMAFYSNALEDEVIPLCAALAAKEHGDARKALDLLRKAGELAERRGAEKVTAEHVRFAQDDIEKDRVREYCENLPLHQKVILLSIYHLQKKRRQVEIITGDVYAYYREFVKVIPGLDPLTQRRVSELIRELDLAGIINARVISRGKYGRTKFIKLNIEPDRIPKYLKSDPHLSDLIDYMPNIILERRTLTRYMGMPYKKITNY